MDELRTEQGRIRGIFDPFSCFGKNAVCRLSSNGDYTLYINGRMAGINQYGDFEHYKIYDEVDISGFLREGEILRRYRPVPAGVIFEIVSAR